MPAGLSHHALGQPRRARRVNHIDAICALDRHTLAHPLAPQRGAPHEAVPAPLAALPPQRVPGQLLALPDEGPRGLPLGEALGLLDVVPIGDGGLGAVDAAGGGEDDARAARVDALGEGLGREAAEDDGVEGTEARSGEDADEDGGDHGHIDEHDVAPAHALVAQDGSEGLDLIEELGVGDALLGARDWAVIEDGRTLAMAGEDVAVDAVVAGGDLAVRKPLPVVMRDVGFGKSLGIFPEGGGRGLVPVEIGGLLCPEGLWRAQRGGVQVVLGMRHGN